MSARTEIGVVREATVLRPHRRRRRALRTTSATMALVALGAAGWAALGGGLPGTDPSTTPASQGAGTATADVTRQTLTETLTESGTLGYGRAATLGARGQGTLTTLPSSGEVIARGEALYWVDAKPAVVLLYGSVPAYRDLTAGTEGADVEQLEKNLSSLGYDGFTVDDQFTSATADAVREWQDDLGLAETGTVDRNRVMYAVGPVRVQALAAAVGDLIQPGAKLYTWTGSERVVSVELDVNERRMVRKGAKVTVTLPGGTTVPGSVAGVETIVTSGGDGSDGGGEGGGGGGDSTTAVKVTVGVADAKALAHLEAAAVDVGFTASQRPDVLTVPVAALLALAEGGHGVEVVDGTSRKIVAVQTGLFANGRVEVTGAGLGEGTKVVVPS